jgi:hypothetical protein
VCHWIQRIGEVFSSSCGLAAQCLSGINRCRTADILETVNLADEGFLLRSSLQALGFNALFGRPLDGQG